MLDVVDVLEDMVDELDEEVVDALADKVGDMVDKVVDKVVGLEVLEDVMGVDDVICEAEGNVDVEVIVGCVVDEGVDPVLVDDDPVWVTTG